MDVSARGGKHFPTIRFVFHVYALRSRSRHSQMAYTQHRAHIGHSVQLRKNPKWNERKSEKRRQNRTYKNMNAISWKHTALMLPLALAHVPPLFSALISTTMSHLDVVRFSYRHTLTHGAVYSVGMLFGWRQCSSHAASCQQPASEHRTNERCINTRESFCLSTLAQNWWNFWGDILLFPFHSVCANACAWCRRRSLCASANALSLPPRPHLVIN